MIVTLTTACTCGCGREFRGSECINHNRKTGEERVVWKRVQIAKGNSQKFYFHGRGEQPSFPCPHCKQAVSVL